MIILQLLFMETLPLRAMARFWGAIHQIDLPVPFRAPLYELWTYIFNCNLDVRLHLFYSHGEQESFTHSLLCIFLCSQEMAYPLDAYKNLNEFFTRPLKPTARPIDSGDLVCPSDGKMSVMGRVPANGQIEQVKVSARYIPLQWPL